MAESDKTSNDIVTAQQAGLGGGTGRRTGLKKPGVSTPVVGFPPESTTLRSGDPSLPVPNRPLKPYYEHAGITIYHGDCREILPTLSSVDLVLTDPPYPGLKGGMVHLNLGGVSRHAVFGSKSVGEPWNLKIEDWLPDVRVVAKFGAFIFCSFHSVADLRMAIGEVEAAYLLTWYKRNSPIAVCNVPRFTSEFIWAFKFASGLKWRELKTTVFDIPTPQGGCMAVERFQDRDGRSEHPTQKPIALILKLLAVGGDCVLDPFMGTGTTLEAAKAHNCKGIGIDIEERYCEIAAQRLSQEVLCFD